MFAFRFPGRGFVFTGLGSETKAQTDEKARQFDFGFVVEILGPPCGVLQQFSERSVAVVVGDVESSSLSDQRHHSFLAAARACEV